MASERAWCPKCDKDIDTKCLDEKHLGIRLRLQKQEFINKNEYTHDVAWPVHLEVMIKEPLAGLWTLTMLNGCTLLKQVYPSALDTPSNRLAFIVQVPALDDDAAYFRVADVRVAVNGETAGCVINVQRPPAPLDDSDTDRDMEIRLR